MPFYGADVDQLKALSKTLASGASLLTNRARELDSLIAQGGFWQGQDSKRFASDWQGRLRPLLERTSRGLEEASKSVLTNADEQSNASTEGSGGSSGNGSGNHSGNPAVDATTKATDPTQPTPQEILDQYQVSDAETTNWPGDWDPLRFVVDQKVVTEKEAELLNGLGPFELNAFKGIHDDAFSVADERFPSEDRNDDQNDAFRHAYWNALMVKEFGADWAEDYATAHEQLPGNPAPREAMDLYNNEVGRNVAIANPDASAEELADLIEEAVNSGDTVVVGPDLVPHPSNQVPADQTGDAGNAEPAPGEDPEFNDESRTTS
ncbi:WXG100 family type VII secretion target [Arthrobacter sp. ISL-95]|uniref:WXG100 family type VII secretion target n=1 Tax=Arthrobacter sp. ISL-95 TaxID=2819116 RepID=UPI001BE7741D|nr:WXG100 family type VII secretion target [Arthrobacter sp. ISL-95]MBT2586833.1 WXG100 family type VII secretion target [Arthrobacter sp. ISL-95]